MTFAMEAKLRAFLTTRHPPKTFCPSEVARSLLETDLAELGAETWREAMPAVREIVFEWRAEGKCEVLQKGEVLGEEVGLEDVKGPIRVRRTEVFAGEEEDDMRDFT
ncbi:hypothetical protein B0A48_01210 [Cryoendolithus antarcticus]|uniref:Uncharacterized protein n=1 Tax=Cryoendolithus antarcticus TaxID=1507870 RepID=A0A1V8TSM6_9PEZI|nr:hypothetical protein B0A48_01210 [Cryoendolithus antarcticus]